MPKAQLCEVATIDRNIVSPRTITSGTLYVGLEHLNSDGVISEPKSVQPGDIASTKFSFDSRHVLYGKLRPYLRKTARPTFTGVCSTDILPILPGSNLDRDYLFHYLRLPQVVATATARSDGVNLPRLSPKKLATFNIPLPPLAEQRRIAAMLDKADAIRQKRREAIGLLDKFLRSAFLEMFGDPVTNPKGWSVVRLDHLADVLSGVTKGRRLTENDLVTIPYMRVANVQDGRILLGDVKEIPATRDEVVRYRLEPGDVLLTEGGDPDKLGRGAVWTGEIDPCIHQNHIFRVRVENDGITPHYLAALISSNMGKRYFLRAAKQTTGIATINRTQLSGFPVLMPPLDLQKKYEIVVNRVKTLSIKVQDAVTCQDDLFNSLAQRAFRAG